MHHLRNSRSLPLFAAGVLCLLLIACQPPDKGMSREEMTAMVDKSLVAWNTGEFTHLDELYSADYIGHWVSGEDSDRETLKQIVAESLAAFPDKTEEVVHIVAEGDLVVSHFIASGTLVEEDDGSESPPKRISRPEIAIHRVVDGKIVEQWTVADQLTLMQQLGLM